MIKAIETVYKGYRFRSRPEGRWAVFFDKLGVEYQYELDGYFLPKELGKTEAVLYFPEHGDGFGDLRYLPDFWLPKLELFVEIKGENPSEKEYAKAHRLQKLTGNEVALLGPVPYPQLIDNWAVLKGYQTYQSNFMYGDGYVGVCGGDFPYAFCECPFCRVIGFTFDGRSARIGCGCEQHKQVANGDKTYNNATPRLVAAYARARQARFEHGE